MSESFGENIPSVEEAEPRIENSEIKEIVPYFETMVRQLKPEIEKGTYDVLISDEVGGRIPTLILRKIIKEKTGRDIRTFFVAAGRGNIDSRAITEFVNKNKLQKAKRALVVTEYIASGDSIKNLARVLEGAGVKSFDVASVTSSMWHKKLERFEKELNHTLYCGTTDLMIQPELYNFSSELGGIEKIIEKVNEKKDEKNIVSAHPKRLKDIKRSPKAIPLSGEELKSVHERYQELIESARRDVQTVAGKIMKEVWPIESKKQDLPKSTDL